MRGAFDLLLKDAGSPFMISWNPRGNSFAIGGKGRVYIFDYGGNEIDSFEMITNDYIKYLDWNGEGSTLAILQVRNFSFFILHYLLPMPLTTMDGYVSSFSVGENW
jgi:hypothetical protein